MEYLYIFIIIALNKPTIYHYILFFLILYLSALKYFIRYFIYKYNVLNVRLSIYDLIPLLFVLVWVYGLLIGIIYGNKKEFIISNFAGMLTYIFYYVIVFSKLSKEKVFGILFYSTLFVMLATILLKLSVYYGVSHNLFITAILGEVRGGTSTGHDRIYFLGQISLYILFAITLARFFEKKKYISSFHYFSLKKYEILKFRNPLIPLFLLILTIYTLIIVPASKGFILGGIVMFSCFSFGIFKNYIMRYRINKNIYLLVLIVLLTWVTFLKLDYDKILISIFSTEDLSNIVRIEQSYVLLNNMTFFGKGLGAVLPFGYFRNIDLPYGFEVQFLNIFHKFGIFALILIYCYFYSFYIAMKYITKYNNHHFNFHAAGLGGLFFLFPSIGNPLLFHPQSVLLHCISLYMFRYSSTYGVNSGK